MVHLGDEEGIDTASRRALSGARPSAVCANWISQPLRDVVHISLYTEFALQTQRANLRFALLSIKRRGTNDRSRRFQSDPIFRKASQAAERRSLVSLQAYAAAAGTLREDRNECVAGAVKGAVPSLAQIATSDGGSLAQGEGACRTHSTA
jgi:hypothetical protein